MNAGGDITSGVSDLKDLLERVLSLQPKWTSLNTPETADRGLLVRKISKTILGPMIPETPALDPSDLAVNGRDGAGRKTRVPWIRIHSKLRSPRATEGWYAVYLFATEGSSRTITL